MEYHDDDIFPLLRHLSPSPPNKNDDIEQSPARAGSPLRVVLSNSTETPSGPIVFPFDDERMAPVSSGIVG